MPRGAVRIGYSGAVVDSIVSPDGVALAYAWDGPLVTGETWSGPVTGSVTVAHDSLFQVASQSVNGGGTMAYGYDRDGLLIAAGSLAVTLRDSAGAIRTTALGTVTTSQSYDGHGELASFSAAYQGPPLYEADYERDALGRIATLTETVAGDSTVVHGYGYDARGRLATVREGDSVQGQRRKAESREIGVSLQPPEKTRKLQEALHSKAKGAPSYRFYLLYDKVHREDQLAPVAEVDRCRGSR